MEPNSDIRTLLQKHISGEITSDDRIVLYKMLLDDQNESSIKNALAELCEVGPADSDYNESDWKETIQAILGQKSENKSPRKIRIYKMTWFRAAAVVLIGLLVVSAYLILKPKSGLKTETAKSQINNQDIAPGSNKAVLTLSNGATIILDSAHNGLLATQSSSNVVKKDSGQLVYMDNETEKPTDNSAEIKFNTLSTPRGGKFQITLPDGSDVWLNAASSIIYPTAFTGKERRVAMTGEAYFEVVHNAKQPFVVSVNNTEVRDIGTHFNINAYPDENSVNTTLLEGRVKVAVNNQSKILTHPQILKPGQQSQIKSEEIKVEDNVDLEKVIAWKNGWFELDNTRLDQLMRQVSRWYDVDVKYEDGAASLAFGGRISNRLPLSKLLQSLEANGNGLKLTIHDKTILVGHN